MPHLWGRVSGVIIIIIIIIVIRQNRITVVTFVESWVGLR